MHSTAPTDQPDLVKPNIEPYPTEPEDSNNALAHELAGSTPKRTRFPIPARLKLFMQFFQNCYEYFEENSKAQVAVSQTAEWLLDNFYVIEQAVRQVEEDLPADYYRRLPKMPDGWARIHIVALANTHWEDTRLDIEQIKSFLQAFQEITPLSTGELWALPLMLRLTVLESLASALSAVTGLKWDSLSPPRLKSGGEPSVAPPSPPDPDMAVANSILDLRLLATQDWKAFFEETSILEKILRRDPADIYARMDFETRNHYRSIVEEMANGSSLSEAEIAERTVQLARKGRSSRQNHVGFYLLLPGRETLEESIKFRPEFKGALVRAIQKNATVIYLGSLAALTFLACFLIVLFAFRSGGTTTQLIVAGILSLLPVSSVAIEIINDFFISIIPPRTLPKLNFESGVPEEYRTMVAVPALLGTKRDAPFLLSQIERHFIGNSDPNIFFALITDYADASEKEMPDDLEPVEQTRAAIEQLNNKYSTDGYRPFYFFHRERLWNGSEERWMGWERKRGKLEEFNKLLRGSASTTFIFKDGDLNVLPTIRYVITLDADTVLPREAARHLIGTLAHPLNQAEFDPATGEIKAGHTILRSEERRVGKECRS